MRLKLRGRKQRHMHRHLVTIEVSVKCTAHERMQAYRIAFYKDGLKRLYAQSVKRWSAVE